MLYVEPHRANENSPGTVPTNRNSTYEMLDRLLKLRWPITAVLSDNEVTKVSDRYLDLRTEQWKLAEDLIPILELFSIATTFFSYEENVSLSAVFPILHGILDQLGTTEHSEELSQSTAV